jgi:hypothetical protein
VASPGTIDQWGREVPPQSTTSVTTMVVASASVPSPANSSNAVARNQMLEINCSIVTFLEIQVPGTAISRKYFARIYMVENV